MTFILKKHAWSMSCAAQCMALHWIYNFDEIRDINKCYICLSLLKNSLLIPRD